MQDYTAAFVRFAGPSRYEVLLEQAELLVAEAGICAVPECVDVTDVLSTTVPLCQQHAAQVYREYADSIRDLLNSPMSRAVVDDCDRIPRRRAVLASPSREPAAEGTA